MGEGGKKDEGLRIDKNSSRASEGRLERGDDLVGVKSLSEDADSTKEVALCSSISISPPTFARSK